MKQILTLYLFFSIFHLIGQDQFNVVYPHESIPNPKTVFIINDTAYATVGGASIENRGISVTITDDLGNNIGFRYYKKDAWDLYHGVENNCIKRGEYYYLGGWAIKPNDDIYDPIDSSYVFILKMDENFDSLTTYTFLHDTLNISLSNISITNDNGFIVAGVTSRRDNGNLTYTNSYDAYMLKINNIGQQEWYKTFGSNGSENDEDYFYKVIQTPDGGYLCAGYTKSWQYYGTVWDRGDWWLVKTNALGNQQWSRRYGHPDYNDGRPFSLMMSSDTSYYIVGNRVITNTGNDKEASAILKLNKNFEDEFLKLYNTPSYTDIGFRDIIENSDGDLVVVGEYRLHDEIDEFGLLAQLYKLNSDGDSIWKRYYTCLDTINTMNLPYSLEQTSDGGYVFTGIAYDNELNPAQQILLIKTDEYGCDGTDWWECATNIAIKEYASNPEFYVYPNPTKNLFFVELKGESRKVKSVEIFNLTGKLVKQLIIDNSQLIIETEGLEKGVYFVKVGEQTQKLVIE
jgi:hypothetical protein